MGKVNYRGDDFNDYIKTPRFRFVSYFCSSLYVRLPPINRPPSVQGAYAEFTQPTLLCFITTHAYQNIFSCFLMPEMPCQSVSLLNASHASTIATPLYILCLICLIQMQIFYLFPILPPSMTNSDRTLLMLIT